MKLQMYLNESSGVAAWMKYFKGIDKVTRTKKVSPIYNSDNKRTGEELEDGEEILVPSSSVFNKGKISVMYKGSPVIIQFANIDKGATKGGETLKINATKLLNTAQNRESTVGSKTFDSKVFYNAQDLSTTLINSLPNMKAIPDNLRNILISYFEGSSYSYINWYGYDNKKHINEIAKYLGEIIIGLCVLNKEYNVLSKNVFDAPVQSFIMPTDSSFAGVDSMFTLKDNTAVPISSKSGKGALASFNANVMPVLTKNNTKTRSPLLSYMIDIQSRLHLKNIEFIYTVGMNWILEPYLKNTSMGRRIMKTPYKIYTNMRLGNITEDEEYVMDIIRNGKWPVMKNMKKINSKLPNSTTYFICQNMAELLNRDADAKDTIINALSSKKFWQANLDLRAFHNGQIKFKMVSSGTTNMKMKQGKGSMNSVTSEQGRLSYELT